ncbi:hypothetical protein HD806DRAFT_545579 [Xylariaceae sp. AK1471]|nr:hypothetical protein HD806DRAFT_545579 [Xylariaceae sp. AK1471]
MPNLALAEAQKTGTYTSSSIPGHNLISRSISMASSTTPTTTLSSGAIAGITIAGSVLLFLLVIGPLLIQLAKWQDRHRAAACPVSSLSFAEHGHHLAQDRDRDAPRRLQKKTAASERVVDLGLGAGGSRGGRLVRHLSLPILPPVLSRPGSFNLGGPFSGGVPGNGGASGSNGQSRADAYAGGQQGSKEKHRGYVIYQNRRKTSWIDEDALHGPRVSPKKSNERKTSWLTGNGLTRTLSRHFSIRRHRTPELARSPTLPCTETGQGREFVDGIPTKLFEGRSIANSQRLREFAGEIEMGPRFPARQGQEQGGSLMNNSPTIAHVRIVHPGPQRVPIPTAALVNPRCRSNTALDAAQQLAGRARVPSLDVAASGQRYSRMQQSSTDAELQAILRRTAERLQDGSRSARRQTLMLPASASSSRLPDQIRPDTNQECGCGKGHMRPGDDTTPSPAKSQKSAPAVMLYSELEGCSPRLPQGLSQNGTPRHTHRRTHTRHVSHVSQVSQVSMLSEPDSLVATPSRRGSQPDILHTALSSPSRAAQTSPTHSQQALNARSYSPASEQSSALSTLYSEEEGSPPISTLNLDRVSKGGSEMERRAMAQALRACDALDGGQRRNDGEYGNEKNGGESLREFQADQSPRPLHIRKGTLGQILPNSIQNAAVTGSTRRDSIKQPEPRISPKAISTFTLQTLKAATEDPFTACTPPARPTPQRLSQLFSPLPAELPGDTVSPSVHISGPSSDTPTPSPSHRRVIPPPHRLQPARSSPTLGQHQEPQLQIQPPTREPSPVVSESGLSSVYESYRYSRYSDSLEGSQMLGRLSTATMLTVPTAEASPTKSRWNEDIIPITTAEGDVYDRVKENGASAFYTAHLRLNTAVGGAGAYTHVIGSHGPSTMEHGSSDKKYTVDDALLRSQQHHEVSLSVISDLTAESTYSQDEDGRDQLAPLMPVASTTASSGKHAMRVTSAVAELRRMNSQVSCVSGYSTATATTACNGEITSPTLPALRGGGFSPGKKGAGGGAKNYRALGSSPSSRRDGEDEYSNGESCRYDNAGSGRNGDDQNGKETAAVEIREDRTVKGGNGSKGAKDETALRRGGVGRSRRNTVVESFEQDLSRARQVLRESRGYNIQAIPEASKKSCGTGGLLTHAAKLMQEEGRVSLESLGLYDDKGFLKSPLARKDLAKHV